MLPYAEKWTFLFTHLLLYLPIFIFQPTISIKQSLFMEAISCPANEKILQNLWISELYYCLHTIQSLVSTLTDKFIPYTPILFFTDQF